MITLSGSSPWKLNIRRDAEGITILRARTFARRAVLPDTLFGRPVVRLGYRAVSPYNSGSDGEEVVLTCGSMPDDETEEKWKNQALQELTLPESLEEVGDYAFQNCASLKSLTLYDKPVRWGRCVLLGCGALSGIHLRRDVPEDFGCMSFFAGELNQELEISVSGPGETYFRLLFPEYEELEEELLTDHLDFHYHLSGAGYQYHHSFVNRRLNLRSYDQQWNTFLTLDFSPSSAARIAYNRLRWPVQLTDKSYALYDQYLKSHPADILPQILLENDTEGLYFLFRHAPPDAEALSAACETVRSMNAVNLLAVLLEELHKRSKDIVEKSFPL